MKLTYTSTKLTWFYTTLNVKCLLSHLLCARDRKCWDEENRVPSLRRAPCLGMQQHPSRKAGLSYLWIPWDCKPAALPSSFLFCLMVDFTLQYLCQDGHPIGNRRISDTQRQRPILKWEKKAGETYGFKIQEKIWALGRPRLKPETGWVPVQQTKP